MSKRSDEPTDAMLEAGVEAAMSHRSYESGADFKGSVRAVYIAMQEADDRRIE